MIRKSALLYVLLCTAQFSFAQSLKLDNIIPLENVSLLSSNIGNKDVKYHDQAVFFVANSNRLHYNDTLQISSVNLLTSVIKTINIKLPEKALKAFRDKNYGIKFCLNNRYLVLLLDQVYVLEYQWLSDSFFWVDNSYSIPIKSTSKNVIAFFDIDFINDSILTVFEMNQLRSIKHYRNPAFVLYNIDIKSRKVLSTMAIDIDFPDFFYYTKGNSYYDCSENNIIFCNIANDKVYSVNPYKQFSDTIKLSSLSETCGIKPERTILNRIYYNNGEASLIRYFDSLENYNNKVCRNESIYCVSDNCILIRKSSPSPDYSRNKIEYLYTYMRTNNEHEYINTGEVLLNDKPTVVTLDNIYELGLSLFVYYPVITAGDKLILFSPKYGKSVAKLLSGEKDSISYDELKKESVDLGYFPSIFVYSLNE